MQREEFKIELIDELQRSLIPRDITLHRGDVTKNNGVVLDGITFQGPNINAAPVLYLDEYYEMYKSGYTISEVVDKATHDLEKGIKNAPEKVDLTAESAREHLYCTIVNTAANEEMLKNVPHEKLEDLSVVARFKVGKDGSFLVNNDVCKTLKMTSEEVMEAAHANTARQEFKCQSMNDVLRDVMVAEGMPEHYVDEVLQDQVGQCPMWVLSNESRIDGAVAMASQDTLKEAHNKLGEDYYILPSSRHEVILVPQSMVSNVKDLESMVHEVNATEVSATDKLSDNVYHFDGRQLSIADSLSEKLSDRLSEGLSDNLAEVLPKCHSHSH